MLGWTTQLDSPRPPLPHPPLPETGHWRFGGPSARSAWVKANPHRQHRASCRTQVLCREEPGLGDSAHIQVGKAWGASSPHAVSQAGCSVIRRTRLQKPARGVVETVQWEKGRNFEEREAVSKGSRVPPLKGAILEASLRKSERAGADGSGRLDDNTRPFVPVWTGSRTTCVSGCQSLFSFLVCQRVF